MSQPAHILVVDDDTETRELLAQYLSQNGYSVDAAVDGRAMDTHIAARAPSLIVLDVMLPGEDGFEICRRLRRDSEVPIIMLTASADDADRIIGLEFGADDYLGKPFNPRELLARIKAVLRRAGAGSRRGAPAAVPRRLRFGPWELDTGTRVLTHTNGLRLEIGGSDYALLMVLLRHPLQVISRDRLYELTRNRESTPFDRGLDVQVCRLRQRLEDDPATPQLIKTVRGRGYLLATAVEALP